MKNIITPFSILLVCLIAIFESTIAQTKIYGTLHDNITINKVIDLTKAVGVVAGSAGVSPTGAATYNIPILITPGSNGFEPSVSLNYSSQAGNGVGGYGWSIAGLSVISRANKNWFNDGEVAPTSISAQDAFTLDGARLMLLSGTYGSVGAVYGTESENYARVEVMSVNADGPDWFEVTSKEGVVMEYGKSNSAKITNNGRFVMWRLNKVTDRNGNYYEYVYDNTDNDTRVKEILYTGNTQTGLQPYNKIIFDYSIRLDQNKLYEAGLGYEQKYILDSIRVTGIGPTGLGGVPFKTYQFNHGYDEMYSFLSEVIERGTNGNELNSTIFKYGEQPVDLVNNAQGGFNGNSNNDPTQQYTGDFDGDGIMDILLAETELINNVRFMKKLHVKMRTTNNFQFANITTLSLSGNFEIDDKDKVPFTKHSTLIADFDGNGRDDIMLVKTNNLAGNGGRRIEEFKIYELNATNNGLSVLTTNYPFSGGTTFDKINGSTTNYISMGDFDGDGRADFITYLSNNGNHDLFYSQPTISGNQNMKVHNPYALNPVAGSGFPFANADANYTIDFNGDGKTDIMTIKDGDCKIYTINKTPNGVRPYEVVELHTNGYPTLWHNIYPGDFNGDGKTDILTINSAGLTEIAYSTGITWQKVPFSFGAPLVSSVPPDLNSLGTGDNPIFISDFNGDGKSDIAHIIPKVGANPTKVYVHYSRGTSFLHEEYFYKQHYFNYFLSGDFNGDGRIEIGNTHGMGANGVINFLEIKSDGRERILEKVTDGFNRTTRFQFDKLTDGNNTYNRQAYSANLYPLNHIQAPIYNVWRTTSDNALGGYFDTRYKYEDAIIHRAGRGFLGYKKVITENHTANTKTEVEQGIDQNYYIPLHSNTKSYQLLPINLLSSQSSTYNTTALSNNRFKLEVDETTAYNAQQNVTTTISLLYDNYGNIIQSDKVIVGIAHNTTVSSYIGINGSDPYLPETITSSQWRSGNLTVSSTLAFSYDNRGNMLKQTDFLGLPKSVDIEYTYNSYGQALSKTISSAGLMDRAKRFYYDNRGRFMVRSSKLCNSCGPNATQDTYYSNHSLWGKPIKIKSSDCQETSIAYDGFGRETTTTLPNGVNRNTYRIWDIAANHLFKTFINQAKSPTVVTWFDKLGRDVKQEVESMNGNWVTTAKSYNAKGLLETETNSYIQGLETPITTIHTYDVLNRPLSVSNALGSTNYVYSFNTMSHTATVTATQSGGNYSTTIKGPTGDVIETNDPGGTLRFNYDSWGNKSSILQNSNLVSEFRYDAYNRLIQNVEVNAGKIIYDYNAFADMISQTDASGNTHDFFYDNLGRLIERNGPEGQTLYEYYCREVIDNGEHPGGGGGSEGSPEVDTQPGDLGNLDNKVYCCNDNITRIEGFDGTIEEFDYDQYARLIAKLETVNNVQYATEYTYDIYNNNTSITYPSGVAIDYVYDNRSYLEEVKRQGGVSIYKTDAINGMGQLTAYSMGNTKSTRHTYSNALPSRYETPGVQDYSMVWDFQTGNLDLRLDNLKGISEEFTYDILKRLTSTEVMNGLPQPVITTNYDPFPNIGNTNGNIKTKDDIGYYRYTVPQKHTQSSIAHFTSTTVAPNNISDNTQTIEYTGFQRIENIAEDGWEQIFDYWPEYNRVKSELYHNSNLEETRLYFGDYEVQVTDNGNTTNQIHYIQGADGICAVIVDDNGDESIYYVYKDHLGSINVITDDAGAVLEEYNFGAWGRRRNVQDWTYNGVATSNLSWLNRGFTGHEHMDEFALINMNARLYDPAVGKMISPDNYVSVPQSSQGYNRYAYANNNPLVYIDPDGNFVGSALMGVAFLGESASNLIQGESNPFGKAYNSAAGITNEIGALGQHTMYQSDRASLSVGLNILSLGVGINYSRNDGNISSNFGVGIGLAGPYASGGANVKVGDWNFGLNLSSDFSSYNIGGEASYTAGDWTFGYSGSYYSDDKHYNGGVQIGLNDWSFNINNDFFAFKDQDRGRTQAMQFGYKDLSIGSYMITNDARAEAPDGYMIDESSPIFGKNRGPAGKQSWGKYGKVYQAPLYIGFRSGHQISRLGFSHKSVQDFQQNGIHQSFFKPGNQNYYLNYENFQTGAYIFGGYYNPYSLYGF